MPSTSPANDPSHAPDDVRDQLRKDHEKALAELEALRREHDEERCYQRLKAVRQAWITHALAVETVVYRALENSPASDRANERFIEHELVGGLFDKLMLARPGTHEWHARLNVVRDLFTRHIQSEETDLFPRLGENFDAEALRDIGENFRLAHRKLSLLEQAKAA